MSAGNGFQTHNACIVFRMAFDVAASAYDRFMGRYSVPLAPLFADFAGIGPGLVALDVGCGPGALTAELVRRLGSASVFAVDPSEPFAAAAQERFPGVTVRRAPAEEIPFDDGTFDASLAQLVVHFMADPVAGLREMRRVTRRGGIVAACVWDFASGNAPVSPFWTAALRLDPRANDEGGLAGAREGHLGDLLRQAGFDEVSESALEVRVGHATFNEWWEPYNLGVGPAGAYLASLSTSEQERLRDQCRSMLPAAPFVVSGRAWAARGTA